jgi:acyl carrier protein
MTQQFSEVLNRVKPDILENPGVDLVNAGILDSFDIMSLIVELEQTFSIEFDLNDIIPENFASAQTIWTLVSKYLAGD